MKITGTSSYILVETDEKKVKIQGELLVDGFVAYANTIRYWEAPEETVRVNETEKIKIIEGVLAESARTGFRITFD